MSCAVRVQASCPWCGDVQLPLAVLRLSIENGQPVRYAFHCPSCGDLVRRPADARMQRVLARNGVELAVPDFAEELRNAGFEPEFVDDDET